MLRRSNNTPRLEVAARQVAARVAAADRSIVETTVEIRNVGTRDHSYPALAIAIRTVLKELALSARRLAHVVDVEIDDAFVFYDVLEMDARALSAVELERLAGLALADSLGLDATTLAVRCAVQRDGRSVVACAMPGALLAAIRAAAAEAGFTLRYIEPAFAAFLNRHHSFLRQPDAIVAQHRHNLLMLALRTNGRWRAFAAERLIEGSWPGLQDYCDAFCKRHCVPVLRDLPVWFDTDRDDAPAHTNERWHRLPPALIQL